VAALGFDVLRTACAQDSRLDVMTRFVREWIPTVGDAVAILQSVAGTLTLNAQQHMACDVNGGGTVDIQDAVLIEQYTVGAFTRFPVADTCGSDWIFVPVPSAAANQSVTQPLISAGTCQPGSITFDPISANAANQDFDAILIGDCNLSWPSEGSPTPAAGGWERRVALFACKLQRSTNNVVADPKFGLRAQLFE
jgi:hypothetical protein